SCFASAGKHTPVSDKLVQARHTSAPGHFRSTKLPTLTGLVPRNVRIRRQKDRVTYSGCNWLSRQDEPRYANKGRPHTNNHSEKGCEVSHVRRACAEAQRYLYCTF